MEESLNEDTHGTDEEEVDKLIEEARQIMMDDDRKTNAEMPEVAAVNAHLQIKEVNNLFYIYYYKWMIILVDCSHDNSLSLLLDKYKIFMYIYGINIKLNVLYNLRKKQ